MDYDWIGPDRYGLSFWANYGTETNSKYILSPEQRKFAREGIADERSEKNENILRKRDRFPERLQHLINDCAALKCGPYLDEDHWETGRIDPNDEISREVRRHKLLADPNVETSEIGDLLEDQSETRYESPYSNPEEWWDEILDVLVPKDLTVQERLFFHRWEGLSQELKVGVALGSIARIIQQSDDEEVLGEEIIWGFILAFLGEKQEQIDREKSQIESLVDIIERRMGARLKEAEKMTTKDEIQNEEDINKPYREAIEEGIEEVGVNPHRKVRHRVSQSINVPKARNMEGLDKDEAVEYHRSNARKKTKELVEEFPLAFVDKLYELVDSDIEILAERSVPGIESAEQALCVLWMFETADEENVENSSDEDATPSILTSEAIANELGLNTKVVTRIFNHLRMADANEPNDTKDKEEEDTHDPWTSTGFLIKTSGERGVEWDLTPYGELLCYCACEKEHEVDWIYDFALKAENLSLTERKMVMDTLSEFDVV